MTALAPVNEKIARLIPRLASDRDGEVVATARAIGRQLERAGADWHDLARQLIGEPKHDDGPAIFTDYLEAARWCLTTDRGELSERDRQFCRDMLTILQRWEPRPKQAAWLRALVERLGGVFHG